MVVIGNGAPSSVRQSIIGSNGAFVVARPTAFRTRETFAVICDDDGYPACKLRGLRMLNPAIYAALPLASANSTNVARNIGLDAARRGTYRLRSKDLRAAILVERIEAANGACRLTHN